jgi:hypothetical protein
MSWCTGDSLTVKRGQLYNADPPGQGEIARARLSDAQAEACDYGTLGL